MKVNKINLFDIFNHIFLLLVSFTILLPFFNLLINSFSSSEAAGKVRLDLFFYNFTFDNYIKVLDSKYIWIGYGNTILRMVAGTFLSLFVTSLGAYVLSKKFFPHRNFWTLFIVFTMFFNGGLIPTYLLIKNLNMFDSYLSLILPILVNPFYLVLMRNFFMTLSNELEESATIDGANRFTIYLRIILPVSKPMLATLSLWLAVGHWNAWFDALLYLRSENMFVLQLVLRRIILEGTQQFLENSTEALMTQDNFSTEGLKAAAIYVATFPIICVYPFIQKYFVKGIMIGSLKG